MTEDELIDEIRDYVHNIHKAEPFHGFSFRELREVGEHFALPREKRITELEKENAELRNNGFTVSAMTEQQLKVALEKGEQLEKKIADLKCECRRCVYTDSPCILSDYGKDINGICIHFKDVFDENAELKDIVRNTKAVDESFTLQTIQLTKAKEIIKNLMVFAEMDDREYEKEYKDAEQFLNEVEK